jgi:hypothetical protein
MKKNLLFLGFAVLALSSCKKEYTCVCDDINGDEYFETRKGKDAADACETTTSDALSFTYCEPA